MISGCWVGAAAELIGAFTALRIESGNSRAPASCLNLQDGQVGAKLAEGGGVHNRISPMNGS